MVKISKAKPHVTWPAVPLRCCRKPTRLRRAVSPVRGESGAITGGLRWDHAEAAVRFEHRRRDAVESADAALAHGGPDVLLRHPFVEQGRVVHTTVEQ